MLSFVTHGDQTNRDEMFECCSVPAILAGSGRVEAARQALDRYRQQPKHGRADEIRYDEFAAKLRGWLDDPTSPAQ